MIDYSVNILETIYHEIFRWIIIILDFFKYSSIYDEKIYDSIYIYIKMIHHLIPWNIIKFLYLNFSCNSFQFIINQNLFKVWKFAWISLYSWSSREEKFQIN